MSEVMNVGVMNVGQSFEAICGFILTCENTGKFDFITVSRSFS